MYRSNLFFSSLADESHLDEFYLLCSILELPPILLIDGVDYTNLPPKDSRYDVRVQLQKVLGTPTHPSFEGTSHSECFISLPV